MCGIVGLFLKNKALAPQLGQLTAQMLTVMSERGPDSAGFAIYGAGEAKRIKLTLRADPAIDAQMAADFTQRFGMAAALTRHASHVVLQIPLALEAPVRSWLGETYP